MSQSRNSREDDDDNLSFFNPIKTKNAIHSHHTHRKKRPRSELKQIKSTKAKTRTKNALSPSPPSSPLPPLEKIKDNNSNDESITPKNSPKRQRTQENPASTDRLVENSGSDTEIFSDTEPETDSDPESIDKTAKKINETPLKKQDRIKNTKKLQTAIAKTRTRSKSKSKSKTPLKEKKSSPTKTSIVPLPDIPVLVPDTPEKSSTPPNTPLTTPIVTSISTISTETTMTDISLNPLYTLTPKSKTKTSPVRLLEEEEKQKERENTLNSLPIPFSTTSPVASSTTSPTALPTTSSTTSSTALPSNSTIVSTFSVTPSSSTASTSTSKQLSKMASLFPTFKVAKQLETKYNSQSTFTTSPTDRFKIRNRINNRGSVRAEQFFLRIGAFEPNIKPHLIAPNREDLDRFVVREFDNVVWGLVRRPAVNSPKYNKIPHIREERKGREEMHEKNKPNLNSNLDEKHSQTRSEFNKSMLLKIYGSVSNIPYRLRPLIWSDKDMIEILFILLLIAALIGIIGSFLNPLF